MSTTVRSFSKVNLGLAIGPARADGFHSLVTLYQTLAAHDLVTVTALPAAATRITLTSNDARVPANSNGMAERNTAHKAVRLMLAALGLTAEVEIHIEKRLPVEGGMGAGSANAAAALIALERELEADSSAFPPLRAMELRTRMGHPESHSESHPEPEARAGMGHPEISSSPERAAALSGAERLRIAAEVGSDVPLFLIGGAVLGLGHGEEVYPMPDLPATPCVVALPDVGVSTPQAFRDWDARHTGNNGLITDRVFSDEIEFAPLKPKEGLNGPPSAHIGSLTASSPSGRLSTLSRMLAAALCEPHSSGVLTAGQGLAPGPLAALVRTGIENDFEEVVFPQNPLFGTIKRALAASEQTEQAAIYAALSGSGAALFGLYMTDAAADAAAARLAEMSVRSMRTETLPRDEYWKQMSE